MRDSPASDLWIELIKRIERSLGHAVSSYWIQLPLIRQDHHQIQVSLGLSKKLLLSDVRFDAHDDYPELT